MEFPEIFVQICGKSMCTVVHVMCRKDCPQKFVMRLWVFKIVYNKSI